MFTDEALTGQAGRFVWLELDMEKARNAPLRRRLSLEALPTCYVVDPRDTTVAMKWVGGMTVAQLTRFLEDARLAVERRGEPRGATPADAALARADRSYGAGDNAAAAAAYREALDLAPANWPPYARAVEALLFSAQRAGDLETCARSALAALPRLAGTPSALVAAASGLDAAASLPEDRPARDSLLRALLPAARALLPESALATAADDRSWLYIAVGGAEETLGDTLAARETGVAWAAFLESAAGRARTPHERTVFDSHRVSAYLEIGAPERALPMLEASQRDFPDDYNPPARLALVYKALERWDEGLAACDRALALAYGPRKLLYYNTRVDLLVGKGDRDAARRTLAEALRYAQGLPEGQRSESAIAGLRRRLEALGA